MVFGVRLFLRRGRPSAVVLLLLWGCRPRGRAAAPGGRGAGGVRDPEAPPLDAGALLVGVRGVARVHLVGDEVEEGLLPEGAEVAEADALDDVAKEDEDQDDEDHGPRGDGDADGRRALLALVADGVPRPAGPAGPADRTRVGPGAEVRGDVPPGAGPVEGAAVHLGRLARRAPPALGDGEALEANALPVALDAVRADVVAVDAAVHAGGRQNARVQVRRGVDRIPVEARDAGEARRRADADCGRGVSTVDAGPRPFLVGELALVAGHARGALARGEGARGADVGGRRAALGDEGARGRREADRLPDRRLVAPYCAGVAGAGLADGEAAGGALLKGALPRGADEGPPGGRRAEDGPFCRREGPGGAEVA
mmetsp:Transcript_26634/g.86243  ORF Transcript_26634/g.86243 Transcript_26634/m.86243 type:complete len:369 (-) Transcript_26634:1087-2193(-)